MRSNSLLRSSGDKMSLTSNVDILKKRLWRGKKSAVTINWSKYNTQNIITKCKKKVCIVYAYIIFSGCGSSHRTLIIFSLQRFPEESTSTLTVFWRWMYSYRVRLACILYVIIRMKTQMKNVSGYVCNHSSLRMGTRHCVLFRGSLWERLQRDRLPEAWLKTPNALGIGRWTPMTQANERLRA